MHRSQPFDNSSYNIASHPPDGWAPGLWRKVLATANQLSREELILIWIDSYAREFSGERFNQAVNSILVFSRQELIDLIHEISPESGAWLFRRYGGRKRNKKL